MLLFNILFEIGGGGGDRSLWKIFLKSSPSSDHDNINQIVATIRFANGCRCNCNHLG